MRQLRTALLSTLLLTVLSVPAWAQTLTLSANPTTVQQGQSSTLTRTINVQDPDGPQAVTRTIVVTPATTTTYSASVPGTTITAFATVTVVPAPPPPNAGWSAICDTTMAGSNCPSNASFPAGRGFSFALPFDDVNGEAVLFAGYYADTTIYSNARWGISARTRSVHLIDRVNTHGGYGCADSTQSPFVGHPLGLQWIQNGVWYAEGQLCSGYNAAATSRMDLATHTPLSTIPRWPYSVLFGGALQQCDGTANQCGKIAWENGAVYIPNYGKAIVGLNADQYSLHMTEFNGTDYTDITDLLKGSDGVTCANGSLQCPQPTYMHGAAFLTDGTYLYVFGGVDNSGNQFNNVYRYDPLAHTFLRLDPADGVKPPATHTAFPMAAFDTKRNRIVHYGDNDDLWQFSVATRLWTRFAASGHGPVLSGLDPMTWGTGNGAAYDPVQDAIIFTYQRGQSQAEGIFILQFGGQ